MRDDDEPDGRTYMVVVNEEEQYSIWDAARAIPAGWHHEGTTGSKQECLDHISVVWTDMRPKSLRDAAELGLPRDRFVRTGQDRISRTQHAGPPPAFRSSVICTGTGSYPRAAIASMSPVASEFTTTLRPSLTELSPKTSASASSASTASGNRLSSTRLLPAENAPGK